MKRESRKAPTQADSALTKQDVSLPEKPVMVKEAIEFLIPPPIGTAQLLDLFDGRASVAAARAWRFGRRRLPQWAADIIDRRLAERAAPIDHHRQRIRSAIGPGMGWNKGAKTLAKWRAERAQKTQ